MAIYNIKSHYINGLPSNTLCFLWFNLDIHVKGLIWIFSCICIQRRYWYSIIMTRTCLIAVQVHGPTSQISESPFTVINNNTDNLTFNPLHGLSVQRAMFVNLFFFSLISVFQLNFTGPNDHKIEKKSVRLIIIFCLEEKKNKYYLVNKYFLVLGRIKFMCNACHKSW